MADNSLPEVPSRYVHQQRDDRVQGALSGSISEVGRRHELSPPTDPTSVRARPRAQHLADRRHADGHPRPCQGFPRECAARLEAVRRLFRRELLHREATESHAPFAGGIEAVDAMPHLQGASLRGNFGEELLQGVPQEQEVFVHVEVRAPVGIALTPKFWRQMAASWPDSECLRKLYPKRRVVRMSYQCTLHLSE